MLLHGINHVATITNDIGRLLAFYREVFEADNAVTVGGDPEGPGVRLTILDIGDGTALNIFEIDGNTEAERQTPMFGRGRIDHLGLRAVDLDAFETIRSRLRSRGAADAFVTDFGEDLSLFFTDPDGLEGEVLVTNLDGRRGDQKPPGTLAARYADDQS